MNLFEKFESALTIEEFLARHGSEHDRQRWQATHDQVALTPAQRDLLRQFQRKMNVLVLAGAWCGDCVRQCPIFTHFAEAAPALVIRYLDRDVHADVQRELRINGGNRIPVVVFFSEDGFEVARYGERTLSTYRDMMEKQMGIVCASGIAKPDDPLLVQATQDWLDQFERAQWILRLSPRLRQKHGD
jgi:thiol-disulfide isomerase/thioredoxin